MKRIKKLNLFLQSHWFIVFICVVLGLIPFFWFKPGYIDIGGDSSRLYFYDPLQFIKSFVLNIFLPDSLGIKGGQTYILPFALFLELLHLVLRTPYLLIVFFDGMSIVAAFLAMYGITSELLTKNIQTKQIGNVKCTAFIAGLFYTLIPISSMAGWDIPLIIHTQRFVYPVIFWLLLRYVHTLRTYFLLLAILVSFIFAQNFSWVALPNMLSFILVTLVFLGIYTIGVRKIKIPHIPIIFAIFIFVLVQAFQYLPLLSNVFEKNNAINNQLSQGNGLIDTLHYVDSIASYTMRGYQLVGLTPFSSPAPINITLIIFPLLIVIMLIMNKNIFILIPTSFFLVLYFIVTADITKLGFSVFKMFFILPGFIMFRDFYGRWEDMFLLFYSLLIGYSTFSVLHLLRGYKKIVFLILLVLILTINATPFLSGQISNRILTKDTGVVVHSSLQVDPNFEKVLQSMRNDPHVGRNLSLPIADFDYELVPGVRDDGAYFGPSMIAYLTGKNDLGSSFTLRPFIKGLYTSAKNKDYNTFSNIFPLLGMKTVFYNSDPYTYDVFATFPYNDSKLYMPKTQKEYTGFIQKLPISKQNDYGNKFHIYTVSDSLYLPPIYIAKQAIFLNKKIFSEGSNYNEKNFDVAEYILKHFREDSGDMELRKVFLDKNVSLSTLSNPTIRFSQVNPAKYIVSLTNATKPFLLVFSQSFNQNWKLFLASDQTAKEEATKKNIGSYFNGTLYQKYNTNDVVDRNIFETLGKKPIADSQHFLANAYANAWYVRPIDVQNKTKYTFILELIDQRFIYMGFLISVLGLCSLFIWLGIDIISNKRK